MGSGAAFTPTICGLRTSASTLSVWAIAWTVELVVLELTVLVDIIADCVVTGVDAAGNAGIEGENGGINGGNADNIGGNGNGADLETELDEDDDEDGGGEYNVHDGGYDAEHAVEYDDGHADDEHDDDEHADDEHGAVDAIVAVGRGNGVDTAFICSATLFMKLSFIWRLSTNLSDLGCTHSTLISLMFTPLKLNSLLATCTNMFAGAPAIPYLLPLSARTPYSTDPSTTMMTLLFAGFVWSAGMIPCPCPSLVRISIVAAWMVGMFVPLYIIAFIARLTIRFSSSSFLCTWGLLCFQFMSGSAICIVVPL
jgi:hypothetical protein